MRMHRTSVGDPARAGSALLASIILITALAVISAAYLGLTINKQRRLSSSSDSKRSFYVAEAGLSEALMGLLRGKSGNVGSDQLPASFGDGVFWVEAEEA